MLGRRPEKILVSGYYGFGNTGDEAILQSVINGFKKISPGARPVILSSDPGKTRKLYNVEAVSRNAILSIINMMHQCSLFLSGGGGLLQDSTGWKSVYYYMGLMKLAMMSGCKTMMFGQGIGPLQGEQSRAFVRYVANRADYITLRDHPSAKLLRDLGVTKPPVSVTADMVFCLEPAGEQRIEWIMKNEGVTERNPFYIISLRSWGDSAGFPEQVGKAAASIAYHTGWQPVFIPFQHDTDMEVTRRAWDASGNTGIILSGNYLPDELLSLFCRAHFTIGMRLHSLIFSTVAGIPSVGIAYDPKVSNFMETIQGISLPLAKINEDAVLESVQVILDSYDGYSRTAALRASEFREKALDNIRIASKLAGLKPANRQ
ncbi:MAG: polysaccharide pyruvyl transferase CsaB [Chloroflexi bacterium]|nr:polysaccharide pyruvyl transferase CsaB [Chloroflexota bacterium]